MKKYEVKRMCCVCRERRAKAELVKVVRRTPPRQATPATRLPLEGNYEFAIAAGHAEGRGAYICRDEKCVEMAIKKRALNRSFKCEVPKEIYEKLGNHPAS